jgi:integrase
MRQKLTTASIERLKPPPAGRLEVFDAGLPGFGLRVSASGRRTWFLIYRSQGRQRRHSFTPPYPALSLEAARGRAAALLARLADGQAPAPPVAGTAPLPACPTFETVVAGFIEKYARPRQRTWAETERTLLVNCAGWLERPFREITAADAYALLDGFTAAGHHGKAAVTLKWLRTLWRWAAKRDLCDRPVMDAVEIHIERRLRERVYDDAEIAALWRAADGLGQREGAFLKLLALLGPRKGELAGMADAELDSLERPALWTVPHERTKSAKMARRRVYVVPLPGLAQRVLRPLLGQGEVFGGIRAGTALKERIRSLSGVADWTYHAHRHTIATWLETQGSSEYERGLVLNHAGRGVTAGYSHGYPAELKRELLESWAGHVAAVVEPRAVLFG